MVNLYKDKHVDFVFTHLGLPVAAITEMAVSRDSSLIALSDACIDHLNNEYSTLSRDSGRSFVSKGVSIFCSYCRLPFVLFPAFKPASMPWAR